MEILASNIKIIFFQSDHFFEPPFQKTTQPMSDKCNRNTDRWSGKDIKSINTLSGRWHYWHCYKSEWKSNWRAYFKKGRRKDRRKESIYLKQTNFMLVVMQADFLLTFVLIHPWYSCISRFSTGISKMQNVVFGSLNSLSRCIYPAWHTTRTIFILQSTFWSQNYCFILLDNRRKKKNTKPQQYLTERNNSMRLQCMIHEVTNDKNSKLHTINITVLKIWHSTSFNFFHQQELKAIRQNILFCCSC